MPLAKMYIADIYPKLVLGLLILIVISSTSQSDSFGYVYGFTGQGLKSGNPFYEIASAYPKLPQYYGLLSGMTQSLSFSISGIFAGMAIDKFNRVRILSLACIVWSGTSLVIGSVNSLVVLGLMRLLMGFSLSACEPASYSIVADYFPARFRSRANGLLTSGAYMGSAFSCLMVTIINMIGWRGSYKFMGSVGVAVGLLGLIFIKEPKRNAFAEQKAVKSEPQEGNKILNSFKEIIINPVLRFSGLATMCRMFSQYAFDFYLPTYFMQTYPQFTNEFSVMMSIIVVSCGVMSSLIGGYLADKYSQKSDRAYSMICVIGSLMAIPFFTYAFLSGGNFWLCLLCVSMKYLLGECFWAPNIAMIQNSVPGNKFSTIFGAMNFFVLITGCFSTFIFGQFVNYLGCAQNPLLIGRLLASFGFIGYLGSAISWYFAGKAYKKAK